MGFRPCQDCPERTVASKEAPLLEDGPHWRAHAMTHAVYQSGTELLLSQTWHLTWLSSAQHLIKGSGLFHSADLQVSEIEGDGVGFALIFRMKACQ